MTQSDKTVFELIPKKLDSGWAIYIGQLSRPSWNILLRALSMNKLMEKGDSVEIIEFEKLKKLLVQDLIDVSQVGIVRLEKLISELENLESCLQASFNYDQTLRMDSARTIEQIILLLIATSDNWKQEFSQTYNLNYENVEFEDEMISRQIEIFSLRLSGLTLAEIGTRFGITRERVRQIVLKSYKKIEDDQFFEGLSLREFLEKREGSQKGIKLRLELKEKLEIDLHVRELLDKTPGLKIEEITNQLSLDKIKILDSIQYQTAKFIWQEAKDSINDSQFSDEQILEALRTVEAFESPVSAPKYRELLDRGLIEGPGPQTVAKRFGSWKRACELAEVTFNDSIRESYDVQWTQDEMLQYLSEFLRNKEFGKGIESYDAWRIETMSNAPSGAHVRNNFGTWIDAKNKCLLFMRDNQISTNLLQ